MASILRQNERLETMTGQILTLYRVTEAGGNIEREPLRLVHVVNQVLTDAADYAEHQGVDCKLVVSPESSRASVLGDEGFCSEQSTTSFKTPWITHRQAELFTWRSRWPMIC